MEWLIKSEDDESDFGKNPNERTIEELIKTAVIVVDKHSGPTSHQITDWVKNIFSVSKAGHAGTLDPAVTGVLPVALGNSVKAMPLLMGLNKEYVGVMRLHKDIDGNVLRNEIRNYIGKIKQRPPVRSAVARKEREREIYFFDILEIAERDVLFKSGVQAGTYIRKLVHDIGKNIGGANMTELRRTRVGTFSEEKSFSLMRIRDAYEFWKECDEKFLRQILIPVDSVVAENAKKIFVKDSAIPNIINGSPVYPNGIIRIEKNILAGETIAIYSNNEELIAIGIAKMDSKKMLDAKKGVAVRTDRIIIDRKPKI
jgi:H/ACA ribonucleoprotein complex subunit 4